MLNKKDFAMMFLGILIRAAYISLGIVLGVWFVVSGAIL
jgi:hypothetical protein